MVFNEEKTRIVHLDDGFDFLGFNIRRYRGKLLIKPSKAALRRHRERLSAEVRALRGANAVAVLQRLNPIIRGWSAYYRTVVSSEAFATLDHHLWTLTYKWARRSHPNKSNGWVVHRYFDAFNKSRRDRWVFGNRDSGGYLLRHSWTKSSATRWSQGRRRPTTRPWPSTGPGGDNDTRHRSTASACASSRRNEDAALSVVDCCCSPTMSPKTSPSGSSGSRQPVKRSASKRSPHNGTLEQRMGPSRSVSFTPTAGHGNPPPPASSPTVLLHARDPLGLLEPGAVKVARRVLRGPRCSNAPGLPDLMFNVLAHNLARWATTIGLPDEPTMNTKTLRTRLLDLPGRLTSSAAKPILHLPDSWPWADQFTRMLTNLRAMQLPAAIART